VRRVRKLSEGTINRIAAGEVIERPASVVKELVENAIDAQANQIDVVFRGGGKSLIRVSDDGSGMDADDLLLAVERHATSKLVEDNLTDIETLGFRGEALPSIGSVARLAIVTRADGDAQELKMEGGREAIVAPAARARGTDIEVRDLFFATPARLKFLKTDRSEVAEAVDVVRRLALAHPHVGFSLASEDRRWIDVPQGQSVEDRVKRILGVEFADNSVALEGASEDVSVTGFAGLPTLSRRQGTMQFAFVNGRPVRDKLIMGAVRGAYADVLRPGQFPLVVLFVTCAAERVDVNVHPAKAEVRFRDQGLVRSVIVSAIKRALASRPVRSNSMIASATMAAFQQGVESRPYSPGFSEAAQAAFEISLPPSARMDVATVVAARTDFPLGVAKAQVLGNYIVAQSARGMVVVDQHAAHERIVYERLKRERAGQGVVTQALLVPLVVDLDPDGLAMIESMRDVLHAAGLVVEPFGDAVIVREVPAALAQADIAGLLRDAIDDAKALDQLQTIEQRTNHVLATFACHHSVRSGRTLQHDEMNALLREMETTPNTSECNHGRPTYVELTVEDIERLFGRR
jgi:DNA mismatch repair protein MutL